MPTRNNQPEAIAENANASVLDFLEKSRMPQEKGPSKHRKKVTVVPGASISEEHSFVELTLETITKHKKSGMKSKRKICSEEESKVSNTDSSENEEEVEIDDDFEESKSEDESQEKIETEEEALDDGKHGAKDDEHKRGERYTECDTNNCSSLSNAVNPLPLGMTQTGNWVVVRYKIVQHCKITAKYFVGQVLKAYEKHEFKVKFLRLKEASNKFIFPEREDVADIKHSQIICLLKKPMIDRCSIYTFEEIRILSSMML